MASARAFVRDTGREPSGTLPTAARSSEVSSQPQLSSVACAAQFNPMNLAGPLVAGIGTRARAIAGTTGHLTDLLDHIARDRRDVHSATLLS